MNRDQRYEVDSNGEIVVDTPVTLTTQEREAMIEEMFSINGWEYTLQNRISNSHFEIKLTNSNLNIEKTINLFHGNVRKEDPERNRAEKKIQLGGSDPRGFIENGIILGFYVFEDRTNLENAIIVSWPIEVDKNYPGNPSLRVNAHQDIQPAKNIGYYVDKTSGKNLIVFRPGFIYHFLDSYKSHHYPTDSDANEADQEDSSIFESGYRTPSPFAYNRILFGAPGTGKSFKLKNDMNDLLTSGSYYERVTFHPDYTYSNFIGAYKPVPIINDDGEQIITYEFVPGPFMRVYSNALKNIKSGNPEPQLLLIEELNRANVAAVFGEVFQLLDRDENFVSEYPIQPSEDVKKYLIDTVGPEFENLVEMKIPDNMFIWATMNNADQGVLPLDTAFKRRWDFEYLDTDSGESEIEGNNVVVGTGSHARRVEWNSLRKAINNRLSELNVNEDKLLGTFFVSKRIVVPEEGNEIDAAVFNSVFKHKVLMYLFEDVVKQNPKSLFENCRNAKRYSYICQDFDELGIEIFGPSVVMDIPTIVDGGQPEETDLESTEGPE